MIEVRYMGHHARTGSVIGITKEGIKKGAGVKRLPLEERWISEGWKELRGLPWNLKPDSRDTPLAVTDSERPAQLAPPPPVLPQVRTFYVKREDIENYGPTRGCKGCINIAKGGSVAVPHNPACRERIKALVAKDDAGRIEAYEARIAAADQKRGVLTPSFMEEL